MAQLRYSSQSTGQCYTKFNVNLNYMQLKLPKGYIKWAVIIWG